MRTMKDLKALQSLPIENLELWSVEKIGEFIEFCNKEGSPPYNSFSGGLDSTLMKYLIDKHFPGSMPHVFSNTGIEFSAIVRFVRQQKGVVEIRPKMSFREAVEKTGFPAISKLVSRSVHDLQNPTPRNIATRRLRTTGEKKDGTMSKGGRLPRKWLYLVHGPKLGSACCDILKKEPLERYSKENGNALPIIGTRAEESQSREEAWLSAGCNAFSNKKPASYPIMIWSGQRVLEYILVHNVPYCREIYGNIYSCLETRIMKTTGESSTGCVGCLFGCQFDKLRYVRLLKLDPKKHKYCMDSGAMEVLLHLGLPAYPGQYETMDMFDSD